MVILIFLMTSSLLWLTLPINAEEFVSYDELQQGQFLNNWLILKPIPVTEQKNKDPDEIAQKQAFAQDYLLTAGAESNIQPYEGMKIKIDRHQFEWRRQSGDVINLIDTKPKDYSIAYAWTQINMQEKMTAFIGIGSDDMVKVWLNGKLVHEKWAGRPLRIDEDIVPVEFERGKNNLLLKIQNGIGEWSFACRLMSEEDVAGRKLIEENLKESEHNPLTDDEIKAILRDYVDTDKQDAGIAVGIIDENGVRVICHGKLDNKTNKEVDGDTLFEIGSITKVFTTLLLADMVERGEMNLDDPVQNYLPKSVKVPTHNGKQITLLHLATHTSGLPREPDNYSPKSWRNPYADYTVEQLYSFLSRCKLQRDPGTKQEYSNLGMGLLGHVIALKAGKDYETLIKERICEPLRMNSTTITLTPELKSRLAIGHAAPGRPIINSDFHTLVGNGAIRSTVNDLSKFISANLGLKYSSLTPLMQKTHKTYRLESGLELRLGWEGSSKIGHGGQTLGYRSSLGYDIQKRWGAVVLSSCTNSKLVDPMIDTLIINVSSKPSKTVSLNPQSFDNYVGLYQAADKNKICSVRREGDRLLIHWLEKTYDHTFYPSVEVFPQSQTVFYNQMWDNRATFIVDPNGQAKRLILNGSMNILNRISLQIPEPPVPIEVEPNIYEQYVGQYRCAFLFGLICFGPTLSIHQEKDELGNHLVACVYGNMKDKFNLTYNEIGGEIYPESMNTFFTPVADLKAKFLCQKTKKADEVIIQYNGSTIHMVRISDKPFK